MNLCRPMDDPRPCDVRLLELIAMNPGIGRVEAEKRITRGNTRHAFKKLLDSGLIRCEQGEKHIQ